MTEGEYEVFCAGFDELPIDVFNRVQAEVQFLYLRDESPQNIVPPGSIISLGQKDLAGKKCIIILTPYTIGFPNPPAYFDKKMGEKRVLATYEDHVILHEIAHFALGHAGCENEADRLAKEEAAKKQVEEWVNNRWEFGLDKV